MRPKYVSNRKVPHLFFDGAHIDYNKPHVKTLMTMVFHCPRSKIIYMDVSAIVYDGFGYFLISNLIIFFSLHFQE